MPVEIVLVEKLRLLRPVLRHEVPGNLPFPGGWIDDGIRELTHPVHDFGGASHLAKGGLGGELRALQGRGIKTVYLPVGDAVREQLGFPEAAGGQRVMFVVRLCMADENDAH